MVLLLAAVFTGAVLQRVSGIGFAMVVAPFTIIAIGPAQGVVLVQLCGIASAMLVLTQVLRHVDWRAYGALLPASFGGIAAGALLSSRLPIGPAEVLSAVAMLLLLAGSVSMGRLREMPRGAGAFSAAGGTAGVMTVLAGVGGAALTALQQATRWDHRSFLATLQPYFITLSAGTVLAKLLTTTDAWPALTLPVWGAIAGVMVAGIVLGGVIARWLSPALASRLTVALALVGALAALADGIGKI